ncbi:hypothetical protein NC651_035008 [Populus alba x Populus x berolinensis]|nr:hypothetical protein NC651_035008 [Populus alba x Populus x berolinensis]
MYFCFLIEQYSPFDPLLYQFPFISMCLFHHFQLPYVSKRVPFFFLASRGRRAPKKRRVRTDKS